MLPWRPFALGTAAVVLAMLVSAVLGGTLPGGAATADTPRLPPLDLGPIAPPLPGQPSVPSEDAFYRPPHDLAGADPGDLLRYRTSRVQLAPGGVASAPVRAWQVLYRSTDLLNADGRRLLDQIRHECAAQFATHAGHHLDEYTRAPGLLNFPPVVHAMARNRIGRTAPDMPVLLYRAQLDELIPASVNQAQLAEYCAREVRIRYTEVPAATHIPGGSLGAPSAVAWLADRFAGRPAPTSCQ